MATYKGEKQVGEAEPSARALLDLYELNGGI